MRPPGDALDPATAYQLETSRLIRSRLEPAIALYLLFLGIVVAIEHITPGNHGVAIAYAFEVLICAAAIAAMVKAGRLTRLIASSVSSSLVSTCV